MGSVLVLVLVLLLVLVTSCQPGKGGSHGASVAPKRHSNMVLVFWFLDLLEMRRWRPSMSFSLFFFTCGALAPEAATRAPPASQ